MSSIPARTRNNVSTFPGYGIAATAASSQEKLEYASNRTLFPERINKERLRELPLLRFEGKILLIQEDKDVFPAVEEMQREKRLGFDTETKPTFRKEDETPPPALLQLATEKKAWLFQLRQISNHSPLFSILADDTIEKVGVAPHDDIKGLNRIHEFTPRSFIDISQTATRYGVITAGLRNMAGMFLGGRISKSAQVTNWEQYPLSRKQIVYAATDAWVSIAIYQSMVSEIRKYERSRS
jgi:ribonuclease D